MQLGTGNLECIRESLDVGDQGMTEFSGEPQRW